jgi:hypothetical protein
VASAVSGLRPPRCLNSLKSNICRTRCLLEVPSLELWRNLEIAPKCAGERLKTEILLDLLADYDTTKAVSGGDYPSMCNPAWLCKTNE